MSGIWIERDDGWQLGSPRALPDEATLHRLIRENPQLLPLAGSPQLTVLGSEVQLGTGYADVLAVEQYGRPVIIEVKLDRNAEARKAIVAQVLAYAAFLRGSDIESLERNAAVGRTLRGRGLSSIFDAVKADDQEGAVQADAFRMSLQDYLAQGNFRLVLVLDDVSAELERLVAYLDAITVQALMIDLIKVEVYEVNGTQIALPQRVTPDLSAATPTPSGGGRGATAEGVLTDGSGAFRESIADCTGEVREAFEKLITWAEEVTKLPNMRLRTYAGAGGRFTLMPRIVPDNAGLATIWNDGQPSISVWKSVFDRRAPNSIQVVEQAMKPRTIGQGSSAWQLPDNHLDGLLTALTVAYEEATGG